MSEPLEELKQRIETIEARNNRVEADKAWETSRTRKISICLLTYIIAVVFMTAMNTRNVFLGALVPVIGFYLSAQSLPLIQKWWLKKKK